MAMMMKPDAKPHAAPAVELQVLQKRLPAAQPAALLQAGNFGTLVGESATRRATSGAATAMLPLALRFESLPELVAMQASVLNRMQQLQQGWLHGWNLWLQEFGELKRANTMSEHVEQQFNLASSVGVLLKDQVSDLLNLQENVEVGYSYWLAQKLQPPAT
jgi:hypothetical protein